MWRRWAEPAGGSASDASLCSHADAPCSCAFILEESRSRPGSGGSGGGPVRAGLASWLERWQGSRDGDPTQVMVLSLSAYMNVRRQVPPLWVASASS